MCCITKDSLTRAFVRNTVRDISSIKPDLLQIIISSQVRQKAGLSPEAQGLNRHI